MKGTLGKLAIVAAVCLAVMCVSGCKNNSDDDETCVVTYYPNAPEKATGAENLTPQKQTYPLGSNQQFPEDLFSLAGYRIIGWSIDARSIDARVYLSGHRVGDSFTVYRDIDFYAIWEKIKQITIDGIVYVQRTDDKGNSYYEVLKASNKTDFVIANIRSEVAGIPVTSIGERAFEECSNLTSVSIPNTVTSVGTNAFNGCYKLTSVTIPDSVTKLGGGAFSNCRDLKSVAIPDSVECIDYSTFEYCSSLTSVSIPNSVTKIGKSAFSGCTNLTSVTIPDSVTEIGENTFYYCTNLTSIEIQGVAYIKEGAFSCCSNLTEIILPWYWGNYEKFGYVFYNTDSQADSKSINSFVPQSLKRVTITSGQIRNSMFAECSSLTSIIIGDGITSIGSWAFNDCDGLTTVEISDSVVAGIGKSVFKGCRNLASVIIGDGNPVYSCQDKILYNKEKTSIICALETINGAVMIPNTVTEIEEGAFSNCSRLTSIKIPDSVTEIGEGAFNTCSGLTSIEISNSVTKISKNTFEGCANLTSVTIPDSVTEIGESAFSNCSSLTNIEIPYSVTSISAGTFSKCTKLKTVIYAGTLAQWCEMEGLNEFMYYAEHVYISDGNDLKSMTELVIPNVVTGIKACSFYGCKNLTSVMIPDSVKYISNNAFNDCRSLTNLEIPRSVTRIGESAFSNCISLKSIEIPNSVTYIEEGTFENCSKLESVMIPNSVTSIKNGAFRGCCSITEMQLPFTGASRNETNNTYFDYIFGGTVSSIGNSSYNSLVPQTLKRVTITGNNIVDYAFRGCTGLTNVTILYGAVSIGMGTFTNCKNLASVTIPNSVTGISSMAFYGCMALKVINFEGTKEQWKSIKKGSYWDYSTGGIEGQVVGSYRGYTVSCIDGNI